MTGPGTPASVARVSSRAAPSARSTTWTMVSAGSLAALRTDASTKAVVGSTGETGTVTVPSMAWMVSPFWTELSWASKQAAVEKSLEGTASPVVNRAQAIPAVPTMIRGGMTPSQYRRRGFGPGPDADAGACAGASAGARVGVGRLQIRARVCTEITTVATTTIRRDTPGWKTASTPEPQPGAIQRATSWDPAKG